MQNSIKKTGNGTAVLRDIETLKKNPLIIDKYASSFTDIEGRNWVESLTENTRNLMIDMIAVRTKIIDEYIIGFATAKFSSDEKISFNLKDNSEVSESNNLKNYQLVIVGSGFDTRAFRINEILNFSIFEVDYSDVLALKRTIIERNKFQPICKKHEFVSVDLSNENLIAKLLKKGFNKEIPTLWVLEAITGYLTKEANESLFDQIKSNSVNGSSLIATFLGETEKAYGSQDKKSHKHIYYTDSGMNLINGKGWRAKQEKLSDFAKLFNRNSLLEDYDYWIVYAQLFTNN